MKRSLLVPVIVFLVVGLVALPLYGQDEVKLPQKADLSSIGILLDRIVSLETTDPRTTNAASALIRVTARGLYEMKARGELEPGFVEEKRKELFTNLAEYQSGVLSPEQFAERTSSLYGSIKDEVEVPLVTVTEDTALGRGINRVPGLLAKSPEDLSKGEVTSLARSLSTAYEEKKGKIEVSEPGKGGIEKGEKRGEDQQPGLLKMDRKSQVNRTIMGDEDKEEEKKKQ